MIGINLYRSSHGSYREPTKDYLHVNCAQVFERKDVAMLFGSAGDRKNPVRSRSLD